MALSGYTKICELTVAFTEGSWSASGTDETNYPVPLTDKHFSREEVELIMGMCENDGDDFRVTTNGGSTALDMEIASWDFNNKTFQVFFEVATLTKDADMTFDLYGRNPAASAPTGSDAWNTNFKSVLHGEDSGVPMTDATSNGNDFDATGSNPDFQAAGKIDYGVDFEASSTERLESGSAIFNPSGNDMTLSAWVKRESIGSKHMVLANKDGAGIGRDLLDIEATNKLRTNIGNCNKSSTGTIADTDTFHHVAMVYSDTLNTARLYIDGVYDSEATSVTAESSNDTWVLGAAKGETTANFDGIIDEVRISDAARTDDWIKLEYELIQNPRTYYSTNLTMEQLGWHRKATVDIEGLDDDGVTEDLTDYPMYFRFTTSEYSEMFSGANKASDSFGDLRAIVSGNDEIKDILNLEIDTISVGSYVDIWVKIPTVDYDGTTSIDFYWSRGGGGWRGDGFHDTLDTQQPDADDARGGSQGVWIPAYKVVQHLQEASLDLLDSTSNANDVNAQSNTSQTDGKVSKAREFAGGGSTAYLNIDNSDTINMQDSICMSCWINPDAWGGGNNRRVFQKGNSDDQYSLRKQGSDFLFELAGLTSEELTYGTLPSTDTWTLIHAAWDGSDMYIYYNGSQVATQSSTGSIDTTANNLDIGHKPGSGTATDSFDGTIDEVRLADSAFSASWFKADYLTQNSYTDYRTFNSSSAVGDNPVSAPEKWGHKTVLAMKQCAGLTNIALNITAAQIDTSGDIWDETQTDGRDLRFVQAGAEIPFHIVRWDKVNQKSQIMIYVDITKNLTVYWGAIDNHEEPYIVDSTYGQFSVYDSNYSAYYHMAEGDDAGNEFYDSTSNQNEGAYAYVNQPRLKEGQVLTQQEFNGSNDYNIVPDADVLDLTGDLLIECRFKVDKVSGLQQIFDKEETATTYQYEIRLNDTAIELIVASGAGSQVVLTSTTTMSIDTWYTVAATRNGTTIKLYVNGSEEDSGTLNGTLANTGNLFIGRNAGDATEWLDGIIEYIAVTKDSYRSECYITTVYDNYEEPQYFTKALNINLRGNLKGNLIGRFE